MAQPGSPRLRMRLNRMQSEMDDSLINSFYDDDDDLDDFSRTPSDTSPRTGPRSGHWHALTAIFALTGLRDIPKSSSKTHVTGHASNFRREGGYLLKVQTRSEGTVLESLQAQPDLRPFAPQFMEYVERDGQTYVKMQDVLLSMVDPNLIDVKMGVRTFAEEEVLNPKLRRDLLDKLVAVEPTCPNFDITPEERANGVTKYRFMSLRDAASTTKELGWRLQGLKQGKQTKGSKDFAALRTADSYRPTFRTFFSLASATQRQTLLQKLSALHNALEASDWFAQYEFIGTSILLAYDLKSPEKAGLWLIDFARVDKAPNRLTHTVPWTPGSHEDGFLLGVRNLLTLWKEEFAAMADDATE